MRDRRLQAWLNDRQGRNPQWQRLLKDLGVAP